jgi:hypothetical protein
MKCELKMKGRFNRKGNKNLKMVKRTVGSKQRMLPRIKGKG